MRWPRCASGAHAVGPQHITKTLSWYLSLAPQIMHNLDRACETFAFGSGGEAGGCLLHACMQLDHHAPACCAAVASRGVVMRLQTWQVCVVVLLAAHASHCRPLCCPSTRSGVLRQKLHTMPTISLQPNSHTDSVPPPTFQLPPCRSC